MHIYLGTGQVDHVVILCTRIGRQFGYTFHNIINWFMQI